MIERTYYKDIKKKEIKNKDIKIKEIKTEKMNIENKKKENKLLKLIFLNKRIIKKKEKMKFYLNLS